MITIHRNGCTFVIDYDDVSDTWSWGDHLRVPTFEILNAILILMAHSESRKEAA